jgi:FHA domain
MTNLLNSLGEPQDTVSGSAVLVVKRGPNAGSQFRLDQPVTSAGRHLANNIVVDDITVSRRHAEFLYERGEFRVLDVGSLNGTYVNGEPIHSAVLTTATRFGWGSSGWCFWWNWRQVDAVGVRPLCLRLCEQPQAAVGAMRDDERSPQVRPAVP